MCSYLLGVELKSPNPQAAHDGCKGEYLRPSNTNCADSLQSIQDVSDNTDHKERNKSIC